MVFVCFEKHSMKEIELIKERVDSCLQVGCRRLTTSLKSVNAVEMVFVPDSAMLHSSSDT